MFSKCWAWVRQMLLLPAWQKSRESAPFWNVISTLKQSRRAFLVGSTFRTRIQTHISRLRRGRLADESTCGGQSGAPANLTVNSCLKSSHHIEPSGNLRWTHLGFFDTQFAKVEAFTVNALQLLFNKLQVLSGGSIIYSLQLFKGTRVWSTSLDIKIGYLCITCKEKYF